MINIINSWQFNLIGALICIVIFFQSYKIAVKNVKNDGAATILLQMIAGISILFLVPFFPIKFPQDPKFYILLAIASIFYALTDRLQTTSRKNLEVSVYSILNMLKTFFLVLFGILFFREKIIFMKVLGALLILLGNGILFYKKGNFKINKYALFGVLATFFYVIAITIDIGNSKLFNLPIYIFLVFAIPAIILFLFEKQKLKNVIQEYQKGRKKYFLITGISWGLASIFTLRSYQLGEVTTVAPLLACSVFINIFAAYFFLKERDNILKKIIASLIVIVGVYLTLFFN
jgi:drug/metabolite transporter (DMT)-like permease